MIKKIKKIEKTEGIEIKNLISKCEKYDCLNIPMQFDHQLNYFSEMNSWFLLYSESELIGVLSIFNPLAEIAEISGCIDPDERYKGNFNHLISVVYDELYIYKIRKVLFVVDHTSKSGMGMCRKLNLKCHHLEYLMRYYG